MYTYASPINKFMYNLKAFEIPAKLSRDLQIDLATLETYICMQTKWQSLATLTKRGTRFARKKAENIFIFER